MKKLIPNLYYVTLETGGVFRRVDNFLVGDDLLLIPIDDYSNEGLHSTHEGYNIVKVTNEVGDIIWDKNHIVNNELLDLVDELETKFVKHCVSYPACEGCKYTKVNKCKTAFLIENILG